LVLNFERNLVSLIKNFQIRQRMGAEFGIGGCLSGTAALLSDQEFPVLNGDFLI
jgi:hypothetical protein